MVNNRSGCSGRSVKKYLTVKHSILYLAIMNRLGFQMEGKAPAMPL